jgi:integration host factor subunit beta
VTKKEIVKQISERAQLTQLKTKLIVQWTFDAIIETLVEEGRIELRNFGVFEVKRRKPRRARNPRTNEPVEVEAKNVVTFQPGKVMEEKVRKMAAAPEPKRKPRKGSRPAAEDDTDEMPVPVGIGAGSDGVADGQLTGVGDSGPLPLKPR